MGDLKGLIEGLSEILGLLIGTADAPGAAAVAWAEGGNIAPASPCPLPALPLLNNDTGLDDVERTEETLPPGGSMNRSAKLGEPKPMVPAGLSGGT